MTKITKDDFDALLRLKQRYPDLFGAPEPPVIMTEYGPVTEWVRMRTAMNIAADPEIRAKCEAAMIAKCGGNVDLAMAEMRRRYPEAYGVELA